MDTGYEYQEQPKINGIGRAIANLIVTLIGEKDKIVKAIQEELGGVRFPALYILVDEENDGIYVGESADILLRMKTWMASPPPALPRWSKAMIIWDGRPITTSFFNDTSIRQFLEIKIIEAFKYSDFKTKNKIKSSPPLNYIQKSKALSLLEEISFLLYKQHMISIRRAAAINQDKIDVETLQKIFGDRATDWDRRLEKVKIDGKTSFFRPGSKKPNGWQITLKHHSLKFVGDSQEDGYFIFPRGKVFLIPIEEMRKVFGNLCKTKETLDIYVVFGEDKVVVNAHDKELDITKYAIKQS